MFYNESCIYLRRIKWGFVNLSRQSNEFGRWVTFWPDNVILSFILWQSATLLLVTIKN